MQWEWCSNGFFFWNTAIDDIHKITVNPISYDILIISEATQGVAMLLLKLAVMPAIAWVLAYWVFRLPPVAAAVVVLFAAMPAGANAYLFATRYQRVLNSASGAVALGTLLSAATATLLISVLI